jgi:hypothetical protein
MLDTLQGPSLSSSFGGETTGRFVLGDVTGSVIFLHRVDVDICCGEGPRPAISDTLFRLRAGGDWGAGPRQDRFADGIGRTKAQNEQIPTGNRGGIKDSHLCPGGGHIRIR